MKALQQSFLVVLVCFKVFSKSNYVQFQTCSLLRVKEVISVDVLTVNLPVGHGILRVFTLRTFSGN